MTSVIKDCQIIPHGHQSVPMFDLNDDGLAVVHLQGYLIAPLNLFSERQLAKLGKKSANMDQADD